MNTVVKHSAWILEIFNLDIVLTFNLYHAITHSIWNHDTLLYLYGLPRGVTFAEHDFPVQVQPAAWIYGKSFHFLTVYVHNDFIELHTELQLVPVAIKELEN